MNQEMMTGHTKHSEEMQPCIDACGHCHETCLHIAMVHCLDTGGKFIAPDHFRLMTNCVEICHTTANFLLSASKFQLQLCEICAEICNACAHSCEETGEMEDCAKACQECAKACQDVCIQHKNTH